MPAETATGDSRTATLVARAQEGTSPMTNQKTADQSDNTSADKRVCFVIGPVGDESSDTRRHADQLLRHVITPAARANGIIDVRRADQIESSGVITSEIVALLQSADIVVADLSMANPNVYYELAVRHLLRKPFVHMLRNGDNVPFDVNPTRLIRFDLGDLDSASDAKETLESTIATEISKEPSEIETPFTVALDYQRLVAASGSAPSDAMSELSRAVLRIERDVRRLRRETRISPGRLRPGVPETRIESPGTRRDEERRLVSARTEELATLQAHANQLRERSDNDSHLPDDIPYRQRLDQDFIETQERIDMLSLAIETSRAYLAAFDDQT